MKRPPYPITLVALAVLGLAGCAGTPVVTAVRVPVPVECKETVPDRPVMPTEEFTAKPSLDEFTRAAMAEAGHQGLVQVERINADGSFSYSGYEWATKAFAERMQAKGYDMGWMGQPSTNFAGSGVVDGFGG